MTVSFHTHSNSLIYLLSNVTLYKSQIMNKEIGPHDKEVNVRYIYLYIQLENNIAHKLLREMRTIFKMLQAL
jgi:hypothetical protein